MKKTDWFILLCRIVLVLAALSGPAAFPLAMMGVAPLHELSFVLILPGALALAVGMGFMASPVVQALGVGLFGVNYGWHFAATVLTAHAAFGAAWRLRRTSRPLEPIDR